MVKRNHFLFLKIIQQVLFNCLDRRVSMDRLRRASMASSNSDLANSISPPTVRFTIDTAAIAANQLGFSPVSHKRSQPSSSSRAIQHSGSNPSFGQQQNSKLLFDTSPMKSRQKLTDIDSILYIYINIQLKSINSLLFFFLDPHDLLFDQENHLEFLTTNIDQQTTNEPIHRRVNAIFGDTKVDDRYYEPQKMTEDTIMDVRFCFGFLNFKIYLCFI